jgi:hypothetical protein
MFRAINNFLFLWFYAFIMMVGFTSVFVIMPFSLIFKPKAFTQSTEDKLVKINMFLSKLTANLTEYIDTVWK